MKNKSAKYCAFKTFVVYLSDNHKPKTNIMLKLKEIAFDSDDLSTIVNYLTSRFNTEDARQTIEFDLFDVLNNVQNYVSVEAVLELYTEYAERDENNQTSIIYRSVSKFRITFFYDGEEIKVNDEPIYTAIEKYYEV